MEVTTAEAPGGEDAVQGASSDHTVLFQQIVSIVWYRLLPGRV